ncbi:MAG: hypothetical protein JWO23_1062 [Solirubrobacterales bacterium]|nr:hypothetical protein [Solirubrobacterales bacterium]
MHRPPAPRRIVTLALSAILTFALLVPAAGAAEATIAYTHEGVKAFEQQLASGQIRSATFNKRVRSLRVTLKDGRHVLYRYPPKGEPALASQLQAKGVPVTTLKPAEAAKEASKAPVHHKLRYIAGGILIAVIVIVGAVLLFDRRRKTAME